MAFLPWPGCKFFGSGTKKRVFSIIDTRGDCNKIVKKTGLIT